MKDFLEYVKKNKYVIICVAVVVVMYALGIVDFLTQAIILIALLGCAIFLGKKIQDNEEKIRDFIKNKGYKQEVYYYKEENDKKK